MPFHPGSSCAAGSGDFANLAPNELAGEFFSFIIRQTVPKTPQQVASMKAYQIRFVVDGVYKGGDIAEAEKNLWVGADQVSIQQVERGIGCIPTLGDDQRSYFRVAANLTSNPSVSSTA